MPSTATSILDGLSTSVAVKAPCRTVATSNITLSGLQTISGYTTVEDDRVLVKGQTDATENGIYNASTGSWTRAKDADGNRDLVQGTRVIVRSTTADGVEYELTTANPIVIGTTELTFTLRYGANATYDQTEAEIAAGVTPVDYSYPPKNVLRYGTNTTPGTTDMTAAIQAAIDSLPAAGGEIYVPYGDYVISSTIDLADRVSITIRGESNPTAGSSAASILRCTQTSGARIFDARTTFGAIFDHLTIQQTGVGFTGHVIDFGHSALAMDSAYGGVRDCRISAVSTAASIVNLNKSIIMMIRDTYFVGGNCALLGGGSDYANVINVIGNTFIDQVSAPILNPGFAAQAWMISCNAFEPLSSGAAGAILATDRVTNITFQGNWCGDANSSGDWISATAMDGCVIQGNYFSTGAKGIEVTAALGNAGNEISGNTFTQLTTALDISAASSWAGNYEANFFLTITNVILGSISLGRVMSATDTNHYGSNIFSNAVSNGVGAAISGAVWGVRPGSTLNKGIVVRCESGQAADPFEVTDNSDVMLVGVSANGGFFIRETADLAAPATNYALLYARDNGAGKTQLVVRFATGAVQVIATEP